MSRTARVLVGVLALLAATGLAAWAWSQRGDDGGEAAGRTARTAPVQQQAFNGPPTAEVIARQPLDVALTGTADVVDVRLRKPPRAGLLFDLDTGEVLWRREPERVLPIASLTKMMTALVVAARADPGERVPVTRQALAYEGSGIGLLPKGRRVRLETLLNGLLVVSGNDAAIALAQHVSGSLRRFVAAMNAEAQRMGLPCTRFARPDGLQDRDNHSCAADLAALARAVLDEPRLARVVSRRQVVLPFPIKGGKLWLTSHNPLILTGYRGVTGIKTGYTEKAGRCLVASATRRGVRLGVVLLHSPDPGVQARKLLDSGFAAMAERR